MKDDIEDLVNHRNSGISAFYTSEDCPTPKHIEEQYVRNHITGKLYKRDTLSSDFRAVKEEK